MFRQLERLFWIASALGFTFVTCATQLDQIPLLVEIILSFKLELIGTLSVLLLLSFLRKQLFFSAVFLLIILAQLSEVFLSFKSNDLSNTHNEFMHQGPSVKMLMINLHYGNKNINGFLDLINKEQPDIIFVLEIIGPWMEVIEKLGERYVSYVPKQSFEGLQVRLLSKLPLTEAKMLALNDSLRPVLAAKISLDGHDLRILAAHLSAPQFPERFELRNKQLESLAELVNAEKMPTVLLADLNVTRWSPYFLKFVQNAELIDSRVGRGFLHSWRPFGDAFPIFRAAIDQVLHTPDVRIKNVWLGTDIGSDHLPMVAEVSQHYGTDRNYYQHLRTFSSAQ
jgi:endonuclease/exonuclease/phosphatase (EEP) superfamily protein YafD